MTLFKRTLVICLLAIGFTSCEALTQLINQTAEMINLKNCTFNVKNVSDIRMLDVNLNNGMTKNDLNITQMTKLTSAILQKKLPVTFNVNVSVDNPNSIAASLSKMDYIITLNNKEVVSSTLNKKLSVPANSSGVVSFPISTDLFQLFSGEAADAIVSLAFKLAGASSDPVKLGVKVKPYVSINEQTLAYPDYITINKILN